MSQINILPKEVFNRISAGEVVERPASVVKELFENAVDAKATSIVISVENGGIEEIQVQDDGCGIESDDLKKAFLPHATSKILTAEDLDYIETLGFRGEALASIGAVSRAKIASKTLRGVPMQVICEGGVIGEACEAACVEGTTVTVSSLFYNTPARLKFLKTSKGEEKEVSSLVDRLILANPYIAVKYYVDGKVSRQSYGEGLKDAILNVYGSEALENAYEISAEKNGIYIKGYIGSTNYYKNNRTYQTVIVNGRCVADSTVSSAMQNAYANYLMKRQYPFYVLSITLDPSLVDVNVHPRKAEVRFANNQIVYGSIYSVVSKVLDGSAQALNIVESAPFIAEKKPEDTGEYSPMGIGDLKIDTDLGLGNIDKYHYDKRGDNSENYKGDYDLTPLDVPKASHMHDIGEDFVDYSAEKVVTPAEKEKNDIFEENKRYIEKLETERNSVQGELEGDVPIRFIGQVFNTYLIHECGDELIIIDQHAAHERILFDEFYKLVKTRKVTTQDLLIPFTFRTNSEEAGMIFDMADLFRECGFEIQFHQENSFTVYSVPSELVAIDLNAFFRDVLTDSRFKDEKIPTLIREKLALKACKAAIKSGDKLCLEEINSLMETLKQNWGLKCPHGRPVVVKITRTEIDKWFKRIL